VASYYWKNINAGAGNFPHHAWWQIGWITDYLLSEAALRSGGRINFPRGFVTPKVGPHQSYGFAPGQIFNEKASLILREGLVNPGNANVDYITALASDKNRLFVVLLNNQAEALTIRPRVEAARLTENKKAAWTSASLLTPEGKSSVMAPGPASPPVSLPGFGLAVLSFDFAEK